MDIRCLKVLLSLLRGHLWVVPVIVLLGVFASLAEGLSTGLVIPLLGTFLHEDGGVSQKTVAPVVDMLQQYALLFREDLRVAALALTIPSLIALKSLVLYADNMLSFWISGRIDHRLRVALFRQLLEVGYEYLCVTDNGKLLNTLDGETGRTTEALTTIFGLITRCCMILVFTVLLVLISWQLTLCVFLGVLVISLLTQPLVRRARRIGDESVKASQLLTERSVEVFDDMRIIRAFGQEMREEQRFTAASELARSVSLRMEAVSGLLHPPLEVLYAILFIGVALLAWSLEVGVPTLLAFLLLLYRLQPHVKGIDHDRVHLATLSGAVRDVFALLDRSNKPYLTSGTSPFATLRSSIEFRGVSFSYGDPKEETRPALRDVSLRIRSGEVTAIVGGSGAGKSTIVNLLYRFYDADKGDILIDGRPLAELDLISWRSALAVAGQDAELMTGTVLENIAYGRPKAGRDEVIEAARRADAHAFIEALPKGYETRVGERGLLLSGGERQRLGLARALLRNPKILILDEATNAIDSLSEAYIQSTLERLHGQMTIIVIAHRLSTTRNADQVVVLTEGHVVEAGPPCDLIRAGGLYARLYELQALNPAIANDARVPEASDMPIAGELRAATI